MQPAVFLDRDNTLIHNDGDLGDPRQVRLIQGTASAVASLRGLNYKVVVVTNQGGVARGAFTEQDVDAVNQRINELLRQTTGASIDRFYYCPYHPDGSVDEYRREHPWRKPSPGMIVQAAADMNLDLGHSWLIGDQLRDIEAGKAAGVRTVLLSTNGQSPQSLEVDAFGRRREQVEPDFVARSLVEAVRIVASQRKPEIAEQARALRQSAGAAAGTERTGEPRKLGSAAELVSKSAHAEPHLFDAAQAPTPWDATRARRLPPRSQPGSASDSRLEPVAGLPGTPEKVAPHRLAWVDEDAIAAQAQAGAAPEADAHAEAQAQRFTEPDAEPQAEAETYEQVGDDAAESYAGSRAPAGAAPPSHATAFDESSAAAAQSAVADAYTDAHADGHSDVAPAVDHLDRPRPRTPPAAQTLREILAELRNQRGGGDEFSYLGVIAISLQMVALVCLLAAFFMGQNDDSVFLRWLGGALVVQLATIAMLLFRRGS